MSIRPAECRALDQLGWLKTPSWQPWRTAIRALLADPLTSHDPPDVQALYTQCTERPTWPTLRHKEGWFLVGRRGGKTAAMAKLAVAVACFTDCTPYVSPGEVATVMLLAADRKQARIAYRYVLGLLQSDPTLATLIQGEPTKDLIRLANRVHIEIHAADYRSTRGYTLLACIADEAAFWSRQHTANPDTEVLNAFRPGLGTIPHSLLIGISTVYARRGALFQAFSDHYGKAADPAHPVMVWKASTCTMNPTFNAAIIAAALTSDPAAAKAEYEAEFRGDLESFLTHELVQAAVDAGCPVRPPLPGVYHFAFCDPAGSGGEKADSMTMGISHLEDGGNGQVLAVLDLVVEVRPPFNPDEVVGSFAELCAQYGIASVVGDRYGGLWPASRFNAFGLLYEPAGRTKSEIYLEALPLLSSGRVRLLDQPRLIQQLLALERRSGRSGKDAVDHPVGGKDDVCNAALGALVLAQDVALAEAATASVPRSADDLALERAFITHMGMVGPVSTHEDYVPADDGSAYEGRDMRWSRVGTDGMQRPLW